MAIKTVDYSEGVESFRLIQSTKTSAFESSSSYVVVPHLLFACPVDFVAAKLSRILAGLSCICGRERFRSSLTSWAAT